MLRRIAHLLIAAAFCLASASGMADAPPATIFIYHSDHDLPPGGRQSQRNEHTLAVLRAALDRTRETYGPYELRASPAMHEKFRPSALERGDAGINISAFPSMPGVADKLIPVRIPIDRGLMGFRVLTIRSRDEHRFDEVRSLDDLKAFRFGLLGSWDDVRVLRQDGLPVETGASMDGLMRMLAAGRFDAFSNSPAPAVELYDHYAAADPRIMIETTLALHYPMPFYFWFRNTADGRRRAERIQAGLDSMVRDGTLKALFYKWYGPTLTRLALDRRRVIDLPNPLLDSRDPVGSPDLWYVPGESSPGQ